VGFASAAFTYFPRLSSPVLFHSSFPLVCDPGFVSEDLPPFVMSVVSLGLFMATPDSPGVPLLILAYSVQRAIYERLVFCVHFC